jgi:hypothetical protein
MLISPRRVPAEIHGRDHSTERRKLVPAHVPLHRNRGVPQCRNFTSISLTISRVKIALLNGVLNNQFPNICILNLNIVYIQF